jgi:septal ring factor EnvC (AmiA/AmiB activator)
MCSLKQRSKGNVERLREPPHDDCGDPGCCPESSLRNEAADEIERLRKALELQRQASRDVAATYNEQETEIERLEHMQANLHGHIKRLEDENAKLTSESVDPPQVCGEGRMIDYPECPNCQRYVEAAFQDAIEFSKFRTMLQIADDRMTSLVAENAKLREELERERKAHLELTASYHDATEEIGRLERALELQKQASRDVAATYNEQETEIERLRAALEEIAHVPIDIDAPHYPVSLALAALEKNKP